jgi:NAD(P)-dependent dehydrogenase (short-subunit alcohol dehydrogenase family)
MMMTDMLAGLVNLPDTVLDLHAIRRAAELEEVAAAVTFLAGPDAGYITGGVIDVSGGFQI